MIEIRNVNKVFYQGNEAINALKNIDLTIAEGTIFGVIGSSGAGKSTLIRCVNMLEKPTSGQVIVDGVDLTTLSESALCQTRRNIGMIFPVPLFLSFTISFIILGSCNLFFLLLFSLYTLSSLFSQPCS